MPVENMVWAVVEVGWTHGGSHSIQVNFGPTMAVAQASLSAVSEVPRVPRLGGPSSDILWFYGMAYISQYRTRTQPDGPDQDHNVGAYVAFDPLMTSATAALVVDGGGNQEVAMSMMVWLWS
jgi:hypothetical protein